MAGMTLCSVCERQVRGKAKVEGGASTSTADGATTTAAAASEACALCFGTLNPQFVARVAADVGRAVKNDFYDVKDFVLSLNMPVSLILREEIVKMRDDLGFAGTLASVPFRIRAIDAYIGALYEATGLRPTKCSNLNLTITFSNDEFLKPDCDFLQDHFPDEFIMPAKKMRLAEPPPIESLLTKVKVLSIASRLQADVAKKFNFETPTNNCVSSFELSRDPIFLAGRYCKFSRNLPQSPWTADDHAGSGIVGGSVSEQVCQFLKQKSLADVTRFTASGREDIDVRMLGEGRPFAVQLVNPRKKLPEWSTIEQEINRTFNDIRVSFLRQVTRAEADILKIGEEEKRKTYTALCYSSKRVDPAMLAALQDKAPLELKQKTPVRVLKRRPLIERPRNIFQMHAIPIDDHHFQLRLTTQAGTYVKEFVHGDFGRTRPSLADLIDPESEVDILELDVEMVDLEWPPGNITAQQPVPNGLAK
uniref:tRNA pseudouridine(55) synthase n=1 Tax=Plectus sambesii TaxID=2011161 RepID=A0A914WA07_9BILA